MKETRKTNLIRNKDFFDKYIKEPVIDIGGGTDPITDSAEIFDLSDGDANQILRYRDASTYRTVYSSHCLEHMLNPVDALSQWWQLLKPGGYMIIVVPHEDLYEQGIWPSLARGHLATFRIKNLPTWSPASHNILQLISSLGGSKIISAEVQDHGFDYDLIFPKATPLRERRGFLYRNLNSIAKRYRKLAPKFSKAIMRYMVKKGWFIDQTAYGALAQIQIIAKKLS